MCDILGIFLKSSIVISKRESHLLPQLMEYYQMNTSFGQKILWWSVSPNFYLLRLLNDCPSIRRCLKLIRDYLLVRRLTCKTWWGNVAFAPMHFLPLTPSIVLFWSHIIFIGFLFHQLYKKGVKTQMQARKECKAKFCKIDILIVIIYGRWR